MALGAQAMDVVNLIVRQGMTLTVLGLGLLAAFWLTRWLTSLLFGVRATDPLTFAVIPILLALVALIACLVPARRATKIEPINALRQD